MDRVDDINIDIVPLKHSDREHTVELYAKYLDSGEHILNMIRDCFDYPDFCGFKIQRQNEIIGVLMGCSQMEFTTPKPELVSKLYKAADDAKILTIYFFLVLPEYRKRGYGLKLVQAMRKRIFELGIRYCFIEMWVEHNVIASASKTFSNMGDIVYQERIADFYSDAYKYGVICSSCEGVCKCGAHLILYKIDE